jgi:phosphohistidine phosphatase
MPARQLYILRHAKSAWDTDAPADFDRPLAKRGQKDAPRIGKWMHTHGLKPDVVISSPALRAKQTAIAVCGKLKFKQDAIQFDERIYEASSRTLLQVLADIP